MDTIITLQSIFLVSVRTHTHIHTLPLSLFLASLALSISMPIDPLQYILGMKMEHMCYV